MVHSGQLTEADATLRDWYGITDKSLDRYGDAILGIVNNEVVSAFDIDEWERLENSRVRFYGPASQRWSHLIGTPNPGEQWVSGAARPVKYLDTEVLLGGDVSPKAMALAGVQ